MLWSGTEKPVGGDTRPFAPQVRRWHRRGGDQADRILNAVEKAVRHKPVEEHVALRQETVI